MIYAIGRGAAERVVLLCVLPAFLALATCSADAPTELADTLRAADAAAGGTTSSDESACFLQSQAVAAKASKRALQSGAADAATDAADDVASLLELPFREEMGSNTAAAKNLTALSSKRSSDAAGRDSSENPASLVEMIGSALGLVDDKVDDELDAAGSPKPKKSKVVLMILEMVPLCGPLGIDRFYLGATKTAVAKLIVCICTCLVGGLVWGLLDAIVVIVNSLARKTTINNLGMEADFAEDDIETAHTLAVIGVVVQVFFCCGGPRLISLIFARIKGSKDAQPTANPANAPAAAMLQG